MVEEKLAGPVKINCSGAEMSPWNKSTILEGEPEQGIHFLFRDGSQGNQMWSALWSSEPCSLRFAPQMDCTMYIIEGEMDVDFGNGVIESVRPGDAMAVPRGTVAVCHIKTNFKEFVTYAT